MKRWIAFLLVLTCLIGLSACGDGLYTTSEYRNYQSFAEKHKPGMEKKDVLKKLGCPDGYWDSRGEYCAISQADRDTFQNTPAYTDSAAWVYECWKRPDPAEPYRLTVSFDATGKSLEATMLVVGGG